MFCKQLVLREGRWCCSSEGCYHLVQVTWALNALELLTSSSPGFLSREASWSEPRRWHVITSKCTGPSLPCPHILLPQDCNTLTLACMRVEIYRVFTEPAHLSRWAVMEHLEQRLAPSTHHSVLLTSHCSHNWLSRLGTNTWLVACLMFCIQPHLFWCLLIPIPWINILFKMYFAFF